MKWKNKLKMLLAKTAEMEKTEIYPKTALTNTDKIKTDLVSSATDLVSSVFVSGQLRHISKNSELSDDIMEQNRVANTKEFYNCPNCVAQIPMVEDVCPTCGKRAFDF